MVIIRPLMGPQIHFRSFWTLTGSPSLLAHPTVVGLSRRLSCTPAQAVYRIAQTRGVTPISGTTSEEHMKQDVAVDKIVLDEEESPRIASLTSGFMKLD